MSPVMAVLQQALSSLPNQVPLQDYLRPIDEMEGRARGALGKELWKLKDQLPKLADPSWLPTQGESGLIFAAMSRSILERGEAEGWLVPQKVADEAQRWLDMRSARRGSTAQQRKPAKKAAKRHGWEGPHFPLPLGDPAVLIGDAEGDPSELWRRV